MAFHEKAGRSQDKSLFILSGKLFSSRLFFLARRVAAVAMLPSALSRSDSFRSVHVGRSPLTQSPELGFGLLSFLFLERFCFYAAAATVVRLLLCNGSYTSPLTHR